MTPAPGIHLAEGEQIAGYRIQSYIARGGMAVVYRARDLGLGRWVALKLIAPELAENEKFRQRFIRESELAAAIDHPNILPIYQAGEADGMLYIAMRYVDGQDLGQRLTSTGAMPPQQVLPLFTQIAAALDIAHGHGLVHRDVKPGNVLVSRSDASPQDEHVYLTDFGLTKRSTSLSGYTTAGHFIGTILYVAPEQIAGQTVDKQADIYAMGCVLYEALAGHPPFERDDDAALLWAHMNDSPPPLSSLRQDLPSGVDAVLEHAMAKDPIDRPSSCREVITELRAAFRDRRPQAVRPQPPSTRRDQPSQAPPAELSLPSHQPDPPQPPTLLTGPYQSPVTPAGVEEASKATESETQDPLPSRHASGEPFHEGDASVRTPRRGRQYLAALVVLALVGLAAVAWAQLRSDYADYNGQLHGVEFSLRRPGDWKVQASPDRVCFCPTELAEFPDFSDWASVESLITADPDAAKGLYIQVASELDLGGPAAAVVDMEGRLSGTTPKFSPDPQLTEVAGQQAYAIEGTMQSSPSAPTTTLMFRSFLFNYQHQGVYVIFFSPEDQFGDFDEEMDHVVESLQVTSAGSS